MDRLFSALKERRTRDDAQNYVKLAEQLYKRGIADTIEDAIMMATEIGLGVKTGSLIIGPKLNSVPSISTDTLLDSQVNELFKLVEQLTKPYLVVEQIGLTNGLATRDSTLMIRRIGHEGILGS